MTRKDKYAPDLNIEDLSTFVQEHRRATGYDCTITLHLGTGVGGTDYAEAALRPVGHRGATESPIITRGPLKGRRQAAIFAVLLHLAAQAYADLEAYPWLWTPEKRAEARGE